MSSLQAKRRWRTKEQKMKPRKRLKADNQESSVKNGAVDHRDDGPVKLDDLPWKDVAIPENMDDYGGLYGLEEIDGVDVVKNEDGTRLSFKLSSSRHQHQPFHKSLNAGEEAPSEYRARYDKYSVNEGDEWTGFDDDSDGPDGPTIPPQQRGQQATKASERKSARTEKHKSNSKIEGEKASQATGFALLEEEDDSADADVSAWRVLDLSAEILSSLSRMRFAHPTEIQASAIPPIREGNDLIGKAPTGSGKTLAFGIPIIEHWLSKKAKDKEKGAKTMPKYPLALILLPTRELAHQISNHIEALVSGAGIDEIKVVAITGGLSIQKQRRLLARSDIIVGTPGRLWEVITEGQGVLEAIKHIEFLVVDEADRLLGEGNYKELEEIITLLDKQTTFEDHSEGPKLLSKEEQQFGRHRQTLVFSATFSKSLHQKLSGGKGFRKSQLIHSKTDIMEYLLHKLNFRSDNPAFIDVNPVRQMAANLREGLVECPTATDKDLYLYTLLLYHHPGARALVFVNSISAVKRLVPLLTNLGLLAFPLHSHMPQKARLRSVERFSELSATSTKLPDGQAERKQTSVSSLSPQVQGSKFLVATDVAARGLDIPNITLVLHYHLPRASDAYVHRSGRTARASNAGSSILLCSPEEVAGVRKLVAQVHADASSSPGQGRGQGVNNKQNSAKFYMQTLYPDTRLISELRPRISVAKKMADSVIVKNKKRKEDDFFRAAAEELGVSSPSEDFSDENSSLKQGAKKGRANLDLEEQKGKGAKNRKEGLSVTAEQMRSMKAELKALLDKKINVGVSEKYLVSKGGEEVARLLKERERLSGVGSGKTEEGTTLSMLGIVGNLAPLGWDK